MIFSEERAKVVLIFGDSITAGNELPPEERDQAWPILLERQSGGRLRLVNEGKGGRPTSALDEFEAVLVRHGAPDLLVLALGMNDSRNVSEDCVPTASANLRTMIVRSRRAWGEGLPVLLVGPSNVNEDTLIATKSIATERQANLRDLNESFERLAEETACSFLSLFGRIDSRHLLRDGVHPDREGNHHLASILLPAIQSQIG